MSPAGSQQPHSEARRRQHRALVVLLIGGDRETQTNTPEGIQCQAPDLKDPTAYSQDCAGLAAVQFSDRL